MAGNLTGDIVDLKTRVTNILTRPAAEWAVIAGERTTPADLLLSYAAPLAGVSAIASFIGTSFVGISLPFGTIRVGIIRGISGLIVSWVLSLVAAWIAARVITALAPQFKSHANFDQALKLVVYSSTPAWIGGVLSIIPALSLLTLLLALYGIYIFYLGMPPLMQTPEGQVIPYMVVSAVVIIVIWVIFGVIHSVVLGIAR